MNKFSFRRTVAFALAASVVIAACGGSDDGSSRKRNAALQISNFVVSKPTTISAGWYHSVAIDEDGLIRAWGQNKFGEIASPALRDGGTRFTAISAGNGYTLALDDRGNLYRTGAASYTLPTLRDGATRFTAVTTGGYHGLALDDTGRIQAWGWNANGQTNVPRLRDGASKFTAISAGEFHSLALDDTGNVYAWGQNGSGQTNVPPLRDGGTRFTSISGGAKHSLALDDQGNIYGWGQNSSGQTRVPSLRDGGTRFTSISAGYSHSLALDDRGNIYGWGLNLDGQRNVPKLTDGATRFTSIGAGALHSLALDDRGNTYGWGQNGSGQTNIPSALSPKYARSMPIAMGGLTAYGIEDTGAISTFAGPQWAFENSNYVTVAAGPRHGLALTRSGTVEGWGDYEVGQLNIPDGLNGVVQVAAGYAYSAALKSNGTVVEWGAHTAPSGSFVAKPDNLPRVKLLASGLTHILAVTLDGKVVGWGDNSAGKATPPENLDKVISAAANGYCSVALRENGDLVYWGSCQQSFSETTSLPGATAVAMAELAVASIVNGQIVTWGEDANGLLAAPEGNNYVALSAGTAAFLAVTADGKVVTWGNNHGEPITIPESFGGPAPIVNDEICTDCEVETQEIVVTDEMIEQDAAFYAGLLSPAQQAKFIEALGGSTTKPLTPQEIQELIDAATAAERENSQKALAAALAARVSPVSESVAPVLPASKSPLTKVGSRVTTKKAVTLLGLKKVTKVSFVKPKKAIASCTVTATAITAKSTGTCNVKVRYTDSKKKARTTTLTLSVG